VVLLSASVLILSYPPIPRAEPPVKATLLSDSTSSNGKSTKMKITRRVEEKKEFIAWTSAPTLLALAGARLLAIHRYTSTRRIVTATAILVLLGLGLTCYKVIRRESEREKERKVKQQERLAF
jgi:hypothetical protein